MATKKHNPNLILITEPVDAEQEAASGKYRPSEVQKQFRETVAQCVMETTILTFDGWRAQHAARTQKNVSRRDWDRWNDDPAFQEWFSEAMPGEPTEMEVRIARAVARRKMIERIGNDDASVARSAMMDLEKVSPSQSSTKGQVPTGTRAGVLARVRGKS